MGSELGKLCMACWLGMNSNSGDKSGPIPYCEASSRPRSRGILQMIKYKRSFNLMRVQIKFKFRPFCNFREDVLDQGERLILTKSPDISHIHLAQFHVFQVRLLSLIFSFFGLYRPQRLLGSE